MKKHFIKEEKQSIYDLNQLYDYICSLDPEDGLLEPVIFITEFKKFIINEKKQMKLFKEMEKEILEIK